MRRLWIRLVLWWNDICPKHGQKLCGFCLTCEKEREQTREEYLDKLLKELNP
jgi:hypothetical protein